MTANSTERTAAHPAELLPIEPMDPQVRWIQPGGGVVCRLELAWGYWRRFWLKTFRPGYVRRMAATRKGSFNGCPHEVIDPRDTRRAIAWGLELSRNKHLERPFKRRGIIPV